MVRITDADALDKMTEIEGEDWRKGEEHDRWNPCGFYAFLTEFLILQDGAESPPKKHTHYLTVQDNAAIYGYHGYDRYAVSNTGDIVFMEHYALPKTNTEKARAIGFTIL